jgi:hypothetical protein
MTHRAAPNRFRWLLLVALTGAGCLAASAAHAQTPAPAPAPVSPKAFAAGVTTAKAQSAALAKQAADKATRAQKALASAEAARTKLAAVATPTPAQKDELAGLDLQIGTLKMQFDKLGKIQIEIASIDAQLAAVAAETACASDTKGPKPKLVAAKKTIDGVVGSSTSEIASAKKEATTQAAPKVKILLTGYAKDVQTVATGASALSTSVAKLTDLASKLAVCP